MVHPGPAVTMLTGSRLPTLSMAVNGQAMACELDWVMDVSHTVDPDCGVLWEAAGEQRDAAFVRECPFHCGGYGCIIMSNDLTSCH